VGKPRQRAFGLVLIEIGLWGTFLIPGLIYSLWRVSRGSKAAACRTCGAAALVPISSPAGRRIVGTLVVLALAGCDLLAPDVDAENRRPLLPVPPEYPTWYAEVERCLDSSGAYKSVRWHVASAIYTDGAPINAYISLPHAITIHRDALTAEHTVKHEMVHHVLQQGNEIHDKRGNVPCEVEAIS
jgi:hypothetical protein